MVVAQGLDAFLQGWQLNRSSRYLLAVVNRGSRSLVSLISVLLVGTLLPVLSASPVVAAEYTLGIDVSHWQEENGNVINWTKVAESGQVFVFHKATEGTTYSDPKYSGNRTEAGDAGIAFGAYHYARPNGGDISAAEADAAAEAQHFLSVAQPAPGDLVPVLDIESNDKNLPARRMIAWIHRWLATVEGALGVKPLIYTYPSFWETHLNNTSAFAVDGFPLWIAHYTTEPAPRTPGGNWNGNGWAFWQFTSQASIPGIRGNVDQNRFSGADLNAYKIPGAPLPQPTPEPATPPVNQAPPTITGDTEVGSTLTASQGTWGGSTPQSYSYEWHRCDSNGLGCVGVSQGTSQTYEIKPADYGSRLKATVIATNSAGSSSQDSAPSEVVTDTVAPVPAQMLAPDGAPTLALRMKAAWDSNEAGVEAFDVRYRSTSPGSDFGEYTDVLGDTTQKEVAIDVADGRTYCFSARAIDQAGNRSDWSGERCSAVPLDDRSLSSSGFERRTGSAFFARTMSRGTRHGSVLSVADVRVKDLSLVATKCRGCGRVVVSFNGQRLARIDLSAGTTVNRRIIKIAGFESVRVGTVKVRVISRKLPVKIDGLLLGI